MEQLSVPHMGADDRSRVRAVLGRRRAANLPGRTDPDQPEPLSFAEERLWFLDRLVPDHAYYNVPLAYRLTGELSVPALRHALDTLVARHEALRTAFVETDGRPAAVRRAPAPVHLVEEDLGGLPEAEREAVLRRRLTELAEQPFDLTSGHPCRFALLRLNGREHVLSATLHHIVVDDWAVGIFNRELSAVYAAAVTGRGAPPGALPAPYSAVVAEQRERLTDAVLAGQLEYWTRRLDGLAGVIALPADRPRPAEPSHRGGEVHFGLDAATAGALAGIGRAHDATLFMTLLAAFQALLARYANTDDVAVGHPIAGRVGPGAEAAIGFFANTLVIRTDTGGNPRFGQLLDRVRAAAIEAYAHQELPFERLVDHLHPHRERTYNPLFNVMFALNEVPGRDLALPGLDVRVEPVDRGVVKFDLWLGMHRAPDGALHGTFEYAADLFDAATVERMAAHFQMLVAGVVADPQVRLGELNLLPDAERAALRRWNATGVPVPETTLTELLTEQARCTPEATAVTFGATSLCYARLDELATELAGRLRVAGAAPETTVAVVLERSAELLVALLAVLKTGAAYLPVDPAHPEDRSRAMLADTAPVAVIGRSSALARLVEDGTAACVRWDALAPLPAVPAAPGAPATGDGAVGPDNPAYVIYTSGSTGRPKGVVNTHRGIVNRLLWMQRTYRLDGTDVVVQKTPTTFDVSVWELFWPLLAGAHEVVAPVDAHRDPAELLDLVERHAVTTIHFVPSMLRAFLTALPADGAQRCRTLRRVICSGEELPPDLAQLAHEALPHAELHNLYGPTEAAIDVTAWRHEADDGTVPIGRPIANTDIAILDRYGQPAPVGMPGELHIGGVNLARGYHRRPDLTADRFVPHPYRPAARAYRTGDLARWRSDGAIEFLGRLDDQVKIRGHRVEPAEVAARIRRHPGVRDAAVVTAPGPGGARLVAYVVATPRQAPPDDPTTLAALASAQVDEWRQVFDDVHEASSGEHDADHPDFAGWVSSYTGEPIPPAAMREWRDTTIARLLELRPRRVLELGCGAGLIAHRLAPHVERYHGVDVSGRALGQLVDGLPEDCAAAVSVRQGGAHDLPHLAGEHFDLVVVNSVVQYFPDGAYLARVLDAALGRLSPGGVLFLGDLRHRELLLQFHASVEFARADARTPAAEILRRARHRVADERELVVSPALFTGLAAALPQLAAAEVRVRRGRHDTEMNRYRYDALLWRRGTAEPARQPTAVRRRAVPNARIERDVAVLRLCAAAGPPTTVADVAAALPGAVRPDAQQVEDLFALDGGRQVTWTPGSTAGELDVLALAPPATPGPVAPAAGPPRAVPTDLVSAHVNEPLRPRAQRQLLADLRAALQAQLPDAMVPAVIVPVAALPVSANGKLDRAALPAPDPWLTGDRARRRAPRTPAESALLEVWRDVLGLADVGIDDNYFELGGDSIQGIQIVTRAAAVGLAVTPRMIFQHPTIAELAAAAKPVGTMPADQGPLVGPVPLLPIQRWFLDAGDPTRDVFGQYALYELRENVREAALEAAFGHVLNVHDGLRMRFGRAGAGWHARIAKPGGPVPWSRPTLAAAGTEPASYPDLVREAVADLHRGLHVEHGPLVRAALLHHVPTGRRHLLVAAHHLVVDAVSWSVLSADLAAAYRRIVDGQPPPTPRKTASVRQWGQRLMRLADDRAEREIAFWSDLLAGVDAAGAGHGTVAEVETHTVRLSPAHTAHLLDQLPTRHHRVGEVLLTALARVLGRDAGTDRVTIDLERHGRDAVDDLDVSRTVGWFTVMHPAVLPADPAQDPLRSLAAVKEYLSAVPSAGAGYGLLRYPPEGTARIPTTAAGVRFNYLGRSRPAPVDPADPWTGAPTLASWQSPTMRRRHALEVDAAVTGNRLAVTWRWTRGNRDEAMVRLAEAFVRELTILVDRCLRHSAPVPADFPLARLDQETIDTHFTDPAIVDVYPLAPIQEAILYESRLASRPGVYVEQVTWVQRELDPDLFRTAWNDVIARHGALRTAFRTDVGDQPLQVVYRGAELPDRPVLNWSALSAEAQAEELEALLAADRAAGFDLTRPPLARLTMMDLGGGRTRLLFTCHHLILDGWSASLVFSEALRRYRAYVHGKPVTVTDARPYRDFVAAQGVDDAAREFWRRYLDGLAEPTPLSLGSGDPDARPGEQRTVELPFDRALAARLNEFARQNRVPVSVLIQGAWALVLARYTRRDDVVFGITVSGRSAMPDMDRMVGLFVNTVPVRVRTPGGARVGSWLRALRDDQTRRPEHTPLAVIRESAGIAGDSTVFDTVVSFDNYPMEDDVRRLLADSRHQTRVEDRNSFGLTVGAELGAEPRLRALSDVGSHTPEAVRELLRRLRTVLGELVADADRRLADIALTTTAERVTPSGQYTTDEDSGASTLDAAVRTRARTAAGAPALDDGRHVLGYAELDAAASALAARLRAHRIPPEAVVGIHLPRGRQQVVAGLAALYSGAAFLPLDTAQPVGRLRWQIADAGVGLLVTDRDLPADIGVPVVSPTWHGPAAAPSRAPACGDAAAYVVYTSGSTGAPKGVVVPHAAAARHMRTVAAAYRLVPGDRVLQFSPPTFDISIEQVYAAWTAGATVVTPPEDWPAAEFLAAVTRHGVTVANLPAGYWRQVVEELRAGNATLPPDLPLRMIMLGAEAVDPVAVAAWYRLAGDRVQLLTGYGLTETVITSTVTEVPDGAAPGPVGVGAPLPGRDLYVLDIHGQPAPTGVVGEVHLGGPCLARGYWRRPAATAQRFVPDHVSGRAGARLYRTGDLARWRTDGQLELLGRIDRQVKVRGVRVEPAEVERVLTDAPGVATAVVAACPTVAGGPDELVAFVVGHGAPVSVEELLRACRDRLPQRLVPSAIVPLPSIPLTRHGKVDHEALAGHARSAVRAAGRYVAPRTPFEEIVADVWREVLGCDRVGVEDDFFQLGGHSLRAMRIAARLRRSLGVDVPLALLHDRPRLGELCDAIAELPDGRWADPEIAALLREDRIAG